LTLFSLLNYGMMARMTNPPPARQSAASSLAPTDLRPIRRPVRVFLFVLIGLCVFFVVGYVQRQQQLAVVETAIAAASIRVAEAEQRQAELRALQEKLDDPAHVAELARDVLGMIQPGDQPIVLLAAPAPPVAPAVNNAPVSVPIPGVQPVWRQWFDVVLGSSP
jgi:cell division protein FtsB